MIYTNILAICEARGIPIRKLERESGLGNGVVRRWDDISPQVRFVKAVADYLDVTVDELLREPEGKEKPPTKATGGGRSKRSNAK